MGDPCAWHHAECHQAGGEDQINVEDLEGLLGEPQTPLPHRDTHEPSGADPYLISIQKDGATVDAQPILNFTGAGVSAAADVPNNRINIDIPGGGLVPHAASHENPLGTDQINVNGLPGELAQAQKTAVRKNSGVLVGSRRGLNFIEGAGISISAVDDGINEEVDLTFTNSGAGANNYGETFIPEPDLATVGSASRYTHAKPGSLAAAIAAAGANNAIIRLVEGTYNIPATLTPGLRTTIIGPGDRSATLLWTGAAGGDMFSTSDVNLQNVQLEGGGTARDGIVVAGASHTTLDKVGVNNFARNGIIGNGLYTSIRGCKVFACGGHGIYWVSSELANLVSCIVHACGTAATGPWYGIWADGRVSVHSPFVRDCTGTDSIAGIYLSGSNDAFLNGGTVISCKTGLLMTGGTSVRGTTIRSMSNYGIQVSGHDSDIVGCRIYGTGAGYAGIYCDSDRMEIVGNRIYSPGGHGIQMISDPADGVINGNITISVPGTFDGIRLEGNALRNVINGNRVQGAGTTGISITGLSEDYNVVTSNVIKSSWGASLALAGVGGNNQVSLNVV